MKTNNLTFTTSPKLQPARKLRGFASLALQRRSLYGRERRCNAGKELDNETGLYYYGARYLDPKTGRWLSGDPAMGEYVPSAPVNEEAKKQNQNLPGMGGVFNYANLHAYHYAGNNPVKYTDPDGDAINIAAAVIFAVVGGATCAAVAAADGKPVREIIAAAAGGVVTGGMAGLTMGGSLAVQFGGAALAGTAGYMANSMVKGESYTADGIAGSAMGGAAGVMVPQIAGAMTKAIGKAASSQKVAEAANNIANWLGDGATVKTNKHGDKIFLSEDGTKRVRFDMKHPYPHNNPHVHIQQLTNGEWKSVDPKIDQIFSKDVPHN